VYENKRVAKSAKAMDIVVIPMEPPNVVDEDIVYLLYRSRVDNVDVVVAQNGGCCAMLVPKNGTATAPPCGKNNVAVYPYNNPAADTFQQMAMPLNGQYPVASKWTALAWPPDREPSTKIQSVQNNNCYCALQLFQLKILNTWIQRTV